VQRRSDAVRTLVYLAIACLAGPSVHASDLASYLTGEMAKLELLEAPVSLADHRFEIVALPMKRRSIRSTRKILKNWNAENLQPYGNDPQALAHVLYDEGLFSETKISFTFPTTYLVNKRGEILAIREGFLHWDTPETRALITALKDDEI